MEINSRDLKADEAISMFDALATIGEVDAFIEGDERKTVINAAEERRKALTPSMPKGGEVKGPITEEASDFKAGIQRTKDFVTGGDIIGGIDKVDLKKSEALALEASARAEKSVQTKPEGVVTCEDVLRKMRAEGKEI
jgi:hypothetical protein